MNIYLQETFLKNKDWDVLIVLDACRFDIFAMYLPQTNLKGILNLVDSRSRHTEDWYNLYWKGDNSDKILISAHPRPFKTGAHRTFYQAHGLWDERNWTEPKPALDKLIELQFFYNMKFLVHLIPPHLPYIGKKGKEFLKELGIEGTGVNVYRAVQDYGNQYGFKRPYDCYVESLLEALRIIEEYLPKIKGNVVITSDHGEFIGENGIYDHNYPALEMFHVPWFVCKK